MDIYITKNRVLMQLYKNQDKYSLMTIVVVILTIVACSMVLLYKGI